MPVPQFHCPHCSQPLRIRHSKLIGQWFDCPECHEPIKVVAGASGIHAIRRDGTSAEVQPPLPASVRADAADTQVAASAAGKPDSEPSTATTVSTAAQVPPHETSRVAEPSAEQATEADVDAAGQQRTGQAALAPKANRVRRTGRASHASGPAWTTLSRRLRQWSTPARLGWLVAGVATALLLLLGWGDGALTTSGSGELGDDQSSASGRELVDAGEQQSELVGGATDLVIPPGDALPAGAANGAEAPGDPEAAQPMVQISSQLRRYIETNRQFPPAVVDAEGVPITERLSWIADVVADSAPAGPQPLRDRSWQDPLNDRFVRRPLTAWQNPRVKSLTGPLGFPAAHFVGIAGVGTDGPQLPADHPRAGIFGYGRQTRLDQVADGLSETMMIAGVTTDIGAWAGSGRGTIRPLTEAPYINGPDGFGTGQPDGMYVLMADGSVKFRSARTAPVIFRRMAAMNDGLPLDPKVPGEPGDPRPTEQPAPDGNPVIADAGPPAGAEPAADLPPAGEKPPAEPAEQGVAAKDPPPAVAPANPPGDPAEPAALTPAEIAAALRQPIVQFRTSDVITLAGLLDDLEEMIGAPIVSADDETGIDRPGAPLDVRDQIISVELRETTLGAILRAVLQKAGLEYQIEPGRIRLRTQGEQPAS